MTVHVMTHCVYAGVMLLWFSGMSPVLCLLSVH